MQAITRASRVSRVPTCPRRAISTKIPSELVRAAMEEIKHHKLHVEVIRHETFNVFLIQANYGLLDRKTVHTIGPVAEIHTLSKHSRIPNHVRVHLPNLICYMQTAAQEQTFEGIKAKYVPLQAASAQWKSDEVEQLDPGHFSKLNVVPKAIDVEKESLKYYQMCVRIAVTLAKAQLTDSVPYISLDRLYYGPIFWGTIFNNGWPIGVTKSFSKIGTPLGTFITGNPSNLHNKHIEEMHARLKVQNGSVRLDLDGNPKPECMNKPSGVTRNEAMRYWLKIRDEVIYQACQQVRINNPKEIKIEGINP